MKIFGKDRTLSQQMRIRLGIVFGAVLGVSAVGALVERSDSALAHAPIEFRLALYVFCGVLAVVTMMKRRTPDKTGIKPQWWKT